MYDPRWDIIPLDKRNTRRSELRKCRSSNLSNRTLSRAYNDDFKMWKWKYGTLVRATSEYIPSKKNG